MTQIVSSESNWHNNATFWQNWVNSQRGTGFTDMDAGHLTLFGFQMTKRAVIFRTCLFLDFLKPLKIWCHLGNFYFHCFMGGGPKGKILKTPKASNVRHSYLRILFLFLGEKICHFTLPGINKPPIFFNNALFYFGPPSRFRKGLVILLQNFQCNLPCFSIQQKQKE